MGKDKTGLQKALWAYLLASVLIAGGSWASLFLPFLSMHLQWMIPLAFVGIPWLMLRKEGKKLEEIGAVHEPWRAILFPALLAALVVFPLYFGGFHLVQTLGFNRSWTPVPLDLFEEETPLLDLVLIGPKTLDKRPDKLIPGGVHLWEEGGHIYILGTMKPEDTVGIEVRSSDPLPPFKQFWLRKGKIFTERSSAKSVQTPSESNPGRLGTVKGNQGLFMNMSSVQRWELDVHHGEAKIEAHTIRMGSLGQAPSSGLPLAFHRSFLWIIALVLTHILAVGVPEEIFYRGYIQSHLREVFPDRWTFLGTPWGPSVVATSALFAIGHFIIAFDPARLIVFFPSLLFGWMKNRTGTIGHVAVFHGLCNVALDLFQRHYHG